MVTSPTTFEGRVKADRAGLEQAAASVGVFYGTAALLGTSLVLGGGTHSGYLADVILQLAAVALILAALSDLGRRQLFGHYIGPLLFVACLCLVPLLQLLPLPLAVWQQLPGRDAIADSYRLLNETLPALPLSMSPSDTWLSGLALLPPIAIFLGCLGLGYRRRRLLSLVVIAASVASVFLGLLQLAQGPTSGLRFYDITNPTEAVGFFANRNHFAALLYCALLFTGVWLSDATLTIGLRSRRRTLETTAILLFAAGLIAFIALLVAQLMARSRAGLGLSLLALLGALGLGVGDRRALETDAKTAKIVMATVAVTVVIALQFTFFRILERFGADPLADARIPFARNTMTAAKAYMPFGSGLGTFVPVYQMFEKAADVFPAYANHAHNDYLEVWLETGVVGVALMLWFAIWLLRRTYAVWRSPGDISTLDIALMRASSLVLLLLGLHSFVDYPLRTSAMMAIAAFACSLLIPPIVMDLPETKISGGRPPRGREFRTYDPPLAEPVRAEPKPMHTFEPPKPRERWGRSVEWPETWRQPAKPPKGPRGT